MEDDLKRIVTTVLDTIVFVFLAFSAIAVLSSGRMGISDGTAELAQEKESLLRGLPAGAEPKALGEEALVAVAERPHG